MKLRIKGNSIRLRLSKTELDHFTQQGLLEERTEFGEQDFVYSLQVKPDSMGLSVDFSNLGLRVYMPESLRNEWVNTDTVGFENRMQTMKGKWITILIEKDYACIDNTQEDQSDNFPNPKAAC